MIENNGQLIAVFNSAKQDKLARACVGEVALFYGYDASGHKWSPVAYGFPKDKGWTPDKAASYLSERGIADTPTTSSVMTSLDTVGEFQIGDEDTVGLTDEQVDGFWAVSKVGTWTGWQNGEPTEFKIESRHLQQMAQDYDPNRLEAPVNTDHDSYGPALGWVSELRVNGSFLEAKFKQLSPDLRADLKAGRYRSRSAEIFFGFDKTERAYLGGVAMLGAANPAVKGLPATPNTFADCESAAIFCSSGLPDETRNESVIVFQRSTSEDNNTMDAKDKTLLSEFTDKLAGVFSSKGATEAQDEVIKGLKGELDESNKAVKALTDTVAELKSSNDLATFNSAINTAVSEKRVAPFEAANLIESGKLIGSEARDKIVENVAAREINPLFADLSSDGSVAAAGAQADVANGNALSAKVAELQAADGKLDFRSATLKAIAENPALDHSRK